MYFIFQNNCLWRLSSSCLILEISAVRRKKVTFVYKKKQNGCFGIILSFCLLAEVLVFSQAFWDCPVGCFRELSLSCLWTLLKDPSVNYICDLAQLMSTYLLSSVYVCTFKLLCPHFLHPLWFPSSLPFVNVMQFTSGLPSAVG